jgi:hypothetical protein
MVLQVAKAKFPLTDDDNHKAEMDITEITKLKQLA